MRQPLSYPTLANLAHTHNRRAIVQEKIKNIVSRVEIVKGRGEESTKQALILPLLSALGYNVWDPTVVCPEYSADFAQKKKGQPEKVDYALLFDGEPRIYIEAKTVDEALTGHAGHLARYFNATPTVRLAILTNGLDYWLFTDTAEPNVMDNQPFCVLNLADLSASDFDSLHWFSKAHFDAENVRDTATKTIYTEHLTEFMRQFDLRGRPPSEEFVRWVLGTSGVYDGRLTSSVVERFAPLVGAALTSVHRDIVRRSIAAMDRTVDSAEVNTAEPVAVTEPGPIDESEPDPVDVAESTPPAKAREKSKAMTPEKLAVFDSIREICTKMPEVHALLGELSWASTTGYFAIKSERGPPWLIRLSFGARKAWIGFPLESNEFNKILCSTPVPEAALDSMEEWGMQILTGHSHAPTRIILSKSLRDPADWNRGPTAPRSFLSTLIQAFFRAQGD